MGYIKGSERGQQVLFPSAIDDYVSSDNPVRVIAAFMAALDFKELGFVRGEAAETGRPGYDPRLIMGLYIWGHLNRVRSSRRLERECVRNLEVIWLMENLRPDFKTIADFRKDNGKGIREVVVKFRLWCIQEGLYGREMASVDGSKFQAVNNKERNFTSKKLERMIKQESAEVEKYLQDIEAVDDQEEDEPKISASDLAEKIKRIKESLSKHEQMVSDLKKREEGQVSLTDEESRLMKMSNGGNEVGYNVQMAVDSKHKLIAEYDVVNDCNDQEQLGNIAKKAKEALLVQELTVLSDGGYYNNNNIRECEEAAITVYLPKPRSAKGRGAFGAERFCYDQQRDIYVCPQGEELRFRRNEIHRNIEYRVYLSNVAICRGCPLQGKCIKGKGGRRIRRWVDQPVLDRLRERMMDKPGIMKERKKLAEHPFGTIKRAMDQGYFLLRGIKKVSTEISLTVLAYNLKRVMNIFGSEKIIGSMKVASA